MSKEKYYVKMQSSDQFEEPAKNSNAPDFNSNTNANLKNNQTPNSQTKNNSYDNFDKKQKYNQKPKKEKNNFFMKVFFDLKYVNHKHM